MARDERERAERSDERPQPQPENGGNDNVIEISDDDLSTCENNCELYMNGNTVEELKRLVSKRIGAEKLSTKLLCVKLLEAYDALNGRKATSYQYEYNTKQLLSICNKNGLPST